MNLIQSIIAAIVITILAYAVFDGQQERFKEACNSVHGISVYNGKFWECVK